NPDGSLTLTLNKGDQATLSTKPVSELSKDDLRIAPIPVPAEQQNIFGFSKKTERLPGHAFYAN
ncbi:MAG: hypothetical protein ACPH9O_10300, partial [Akkermansiaceae bacterium]